MLMDGAGDGEQYNSRTVEDVFTDYKSRRVALIKALTTGVLFCFFWGLARFFGSLITAPLKPLSFFLGVCVCVCKIRMRFQSF